MTFNESTVLAIGLGTVVPALTALVTKLRASAQVKELCTACLAALAGGLSGAFQTLPHGAGQWAPILEEIGFAWIAAAAAFVAGSPTRTIVQPVARAIARRSANFGLGRALPEAA